MSRANWIGIALIAGLLGGQAQAASNESAVSPVDLLDSDDDKTIDISEIGKAASDTFDKIDSDGAGKIDLPATGKRLSKTEFKKADADKDGFLDKNEYFAAADGLLRIADQDKDGTLDEKEFNTKEGKILQRLIQ